MRLKKLRPTRGEITSGISISQPRATAIGGIVVGTDTTAIPVAET